MSYFAAKIEVITKENKKLEYTYGYDNEIEPVLEVSEDSFFECKNTKDLLAVIDKAFDSGYEDDNGKHKPQSLSECIEDFICDEPFTEAKKKYNKFKKDVKKLAIDEIDRVTLTVYNLSEDQVSEEETITF